MDDFSTESWNYCCEVNTVLYFSKYVALASASQFREITKPVQNLLDAYPFDSVVDW